MNELKIHSGYCVLLTIFSFWMLPGCKEEVPLPAFEKRSIAGEYFGKDSAWYIDNIPFFECSDTALEQIYYYRWKMYKAHIRSVGTNEYVITEFISHVPWDRDPYCTINAASMHHIYEGRWLRNDVYMNGYIRYLFQQGGNNRSYSESVADAAYKRYLVNADNTFLEAQLDSMITIYNQWDDHWDSAKKMYYIPAMPDATEYTIASIDASGGKAGFDGGDAFRPTINSYMYANAMAISKIAAMKGDYAKSELYDGKAKELKQRVETYLWNDSLQHFTDRYKQDNQYVHYWDFIRGRELAGMIPWNFELPSDDKKYSAAWKHVTDTNYLLGPYGFRTNEPSYEHYFKQFVYFEGKRGSQWNGPSWPYQSSLVLTAMANYLNDYHQSTVTSSDFLHLLRLYTNQHYLPNGDLNLVENYDPNLGEPIVSYYWSNHYNHSSYNNLIISGLCGLRPGSKDSLVIHPLIDSSIRYFRLQDVRYHGQDVTIIYDKDGSKYQLGEGLHVWVNGKNMILHESNGEYSTPIGRPIIVRPRLQPANHALNISKKGFPAATASINNEPDSLNQAIDGRIWYFPEITNRWTTAGSTNDTDWFDIDFGEKVPLSAIKISPTTDGDRLSTPDSIYIQYKQEEDWKDIVIKTEQPLIPNTSNKLVFDKIIANQIRIYFVHTNKQIGISEIECLE